MAKLLVIDDCPTIRAKSRATLQSEGFEVIEARDALAGLQRAVEDAPDLILVAQGLTGLDGFEVCAHIAREPVARGIPIILTTKTAEGEAHNTRSLAAGVCSVVPNSLPRAELVAAVYRVLWLNTAAARERSALSARVSIAPLG